MLPTGLCANTDCRVVMASQKLFSNTHRVLVSEHCKVDWNLLHSPLQVPARVAELADAQDLKSCVLTDVRVQVPPRVLRFLTPQTLFGPPRPTTKKTTPTRFGVNWGLGLGLYWICVDGSFLLQWKEFTHGTPRNKKRLVSRRLSNSRRTLR